MKSSLYNIHVKGNDYTLVFNTFTSSFVKLNSTIANKIEDNNFDDIPQDLITKLKTQGIIVDDVKSQLMQYKYLFYEASFGNQKPFLYIAPTMQCNFACEYCFEKDNKNQGLMDDDIIHSIVKFLKAYGKEDIYIVWFGGEPMLGFSSIITLCDELHKSDIKYSSSMITNGSLFNSRNIYQLEKLNLNFIQFSMDGIGDTQDSRRFFKGGKPSFEIIITNLKELLKKTNIPIVIQITIDHNNLSAYEDTLKYCNEHFSKHIETKRLQIGVNHVQDRTGFDSGKVCLTADEIIMSGIDDINSSKNWIIPQLNFPCMFRSSWHFAIDPEGNVYKCLEHLGDRQKRVGSLREDWISLERIARAALEEDAFQNDECIKCKVFPICGGGCPLDRIAGSKNIKSKKDICSKYKYGLERMLPYVYESVYNNKM